jgi:hypothetical protein
MDDERFEVAIAACLGCAQACRRCEESCDGSPGFATCQHACRDGFDSCFLCLADLHDDPPRAASSCLVCAIVCEHCADACDKHPGEPFRRCAEACRLCAELCRAIASGAAPSRAAGDFRLAIDGLRWAAIDIQGRGAVGD